MILAEAGLETVISSVHLFSTDSEDLRDWLKVKPCEISENHEDLELIPAYILHAQVQYESQVIAVL